MFARDDYAFIKPESIQEHIERDESMERRLAAIRRHFDRQQAEMFGPECPYCTGHDGTAVYGEVGEERCSMCLTGVRS